MTTEEQASYDELVKVNTEQMQRITELKNEVKEVTRQLGVYKTGFETQTKAHHDAQESIRRLRESGRTEAPVEPPTA